MKKQSLPATSKEAMDQAVQTLLENKDAFAKLSPSARITLIQQMARDTMAASADQVAAACQAKGIDLNSPRAAEEWLAGPMTTLRNLRFLTKSLQDIADKGRPQYPAKGVRVLESGQVVVKVLPQAPEDHFLYMGFSAEIWMDPKLKAEDLDASMAHVYQKNTPKEGKVALVLGAGNVSSIGPMDILHKMFVENQVCILKMNPVNEYLGPFVERGFRAAIDAGFLQVTYGGAEEGAYLVHHQDVDEIHITGSDLIHDIIVWGPPGEEQQRRKDTNQPLITKTITSELGCVTPVIIVPGKWSNRELQFQAENVATMLTNNASFNCNAAKLLVTSANWPQREAFLQRVREVLATLPPREAYYPGAKQRHQRFLDAYPDAIQVGASEHGKLSWAFASGLDPNDTQQLAFGTEAWCSILAEVPLDAPSAATFLSHATRFCNDKVWGTLSCNVIIDPRTRRNLGRSFEDALSDLRYGSIGVNHWAALSYALVLTTWGAFPEHTLDNIGSGIGVVHNSLMFGRPQKSVIRGPFFTWPCPVWFATNKISHKTAQLLVSYEFEPSKRKLAKIIGTALKG